MKGIFDKFFDLFILIIGIGVGIYLIYRISSDRLGFGDINISGQIVVSLVVLVWYLLEFFIFINYDSRNTNYIFSRYIIKKAPLTKKLSDPFLWPGTRIFGKNYKWNDDFLMGFGATNSVIVGIASTMLAALMLTIAGVLLFLTGAALA